MKRLLLITALLLAFAPLRAQYSHSIGFGLTATDKCATLRYSYTFFEFEGWLGERLENIGFYGTAGKGRYPEWNLAGAMDHWKVSAGVMVGSAFDIKDWWPSVNIGLARHWINTYPGYEVINQPVFNEWDLEFGSSGQIGHFTPWVTVGIFRQLEMTFGIGIQF